MKKTIIASLLTAAVTVPLTLAVAGPMHRSRANLRAAQQDLNQAWEHINRSQKASEFDEGGHAEKAKALIEQAKEEIRAAVEWEHH
jgi:hypothetical protein